MPQSETLCYSLCMNRIQCQLKASGGLQCLQKRKREGNFVPETLSYKSHFPSQLCHLANDIDMG